MVTLLHRTLALLGLILFIFLNGCAGRVILPDEKEGRLIKTGDKAVVLLRHSADIDSKPVRTLTSTGTGGFSLQIANLDMFEPIRTVSSVSPTLEDRDKGWMYLLLRPGTYYFQVIPAGADQNPAASARDAYSGRWGTIGHGGITLGRTYWFHIPEGQSVVYIGSLSISCTTGWGLFGYLISRCSEITVKDETGEALIVAQKSFGRFDPLKTAPLQEYAPPAFVPTSSQRWNPGISGYDVYTGSLKFPPQSEPPVSIKESEDLYPMGISIAGVTGLDTPGWMKRALSRTTGMGGALQSLGGLGSGDPTGAIGAAYILFYLPPAILVGSVWGQWDKNQWGPCMTKLANNITANPPAARIQSEIDKRLLRTDKLRLFAAGDGKNFYEKASESGLKSILHVEIVKIQLRECEKRGAFFVETVVRSSLRETTGRKPLYNRVFLYSVSLGEHIPFDDYGNYPYLFRLSKTSPCRKMDEYCGEEGEKILNDEISRSIFSLLQTLQPDSGITLNER